MRWCGDPSGKIIFLQHLRSQASQRKNPGVFGHFFVNKTAGPFPKYIFYDFWKKSYRNKKINFKK
jgi:hypothetical protein